MSTGKSLTTFISVEKLNVYEIGHFNDFLALDIIIYLVVIL